MRPFGYYWVVYQGTWEVAEFAPWRNGAGEIVSCTWNRIGEFVEEYTDSDFDFIWEHMLPFPTDYLTGKLPDY